MHEGMAVVGGRVDDAVPPGELAAVTDPLPPPSEVARQVFGPALGVAAKYARLLATDGTVRGLLGPREVPRLWDRHLLNSAVAAPLVPYGAAVVDVGSGAGLPGIVLALVRPDLRITLVEPSARRAAFLQECVDALDLRTTRVHRGRAEDDGTLRAVGGADMVTARAVAPLERLAGWCLPLLRPGGRLAAWKGASAKEELAAAASVLRALGGVDAAIVRCGSGVVDPPTTVVTVTRGTVPARPRGGRRR